MASFVWKSCLAFTSYCLHETLLVLQDVIEVSLLHCHLLYFSFPSFPNSIECLSLLFLWLNHILYLSPASNYSVPTFSISHLIMSASFLGQNCLRHSIWKVEAPHARSYILVSQGKIFVSAFENKENGMVSTTRLYSILFLYPSPTHSLILIKARFYLFLQDYMDWFCLTGIMG